MQVLGLWELRGVITRYSGRRPRWAGWSLWHRDTDHDHTRLADFIFTPQKINHCPRINGRVCSEMPALKEKFNSSRKSVYKWVFSVVVCHQIIELCVVYLTIAVHIRLIQDSLNTVSPTHKLHFPSSDLDLLWCERHPQVVHHRAQLLSTDKPAPILR